MSAGAWERSNAKFLTLIKVDAGVLYEHTPAWRAGDAVRHMPGVLAWAVRRKAMRVF